MFILKIHSIYSQSKIKVSNISWIYSNPYLFPRNFQYSTKVASLGLLDVKKCFTMFAYISRWIKWKENK